MLEDIHVMQDASIHHSRDVNAASDDVYSADDHHGVDADGNKSSFPITTKNETPLQLLRHESEQATISLSPAVSGGGRGVVVKEGEDRATDSMFCQVAIPTNIAGLFIGKQGCNIIRVKVCVCVCVLPLPYMISHI
jgi:hypothetical protein